MNDRAFETFYAQTSQQLWAYLLRICDSREMAKDILQESYIRFLQKPPDSTEQPQMKSYLYTIATRLNIDRAKKLRLRRLKLSAWFASSEEPPSAAADKTDLRIDMRTVFGFLKPQERSLLWLAYVEEQPHSAIAQILEMREKSIKVVLYRARKKLARLLAQFDIDGGQFNE